MNLNNPDTRQQLLSDRVQAGAQLIAKDLAQEFDVSLDTIRRDILALVAKGKARRTRGGAIPVAEPARPLAVKLSAGVTVKPALIDAALTEIGDTKTILVDGGTTTLALVTQLSPSPGRLVMTPSPWIAIACQDKGIEVFILGGTLSPQGGIATGHSALSQMQTVTADIAILGACGIESRFGLSSDDYAEAMMKRAMHDAASKTIVVTDASKIGQRARHQTLALSQIDTIITDAAPSQTDPLVNAGTQVTTPFSS